MMKKNIIGKYSGFSLVELLVVISIIATLIAIIVPNLMGAREKARDSQRIQDLSAMKTALRMYYNDNQAYPTGTGVTLGTGFTGYMPGVLNLGYTYNYYYTNNGDGFVTCLNLESRGGPDTLSAQAKCGIPSLGIAVCGLAVGETSASIYTVCAN